MFVETHPYIVVLRQAEAGRLPASIDSTSSMSVDTIRDLVDSGHIQAIDASNLDGPVFMEPRITTSGREYLRVLECRAQGATLLGRVRVHLPAVGKWVLGIISALVVAALVKRFVG